MMNVKNMELLLRARYDEPWRHYHIWEHVTRMLAEFEDVHDQAQNPTAVEWAIMFHDAVYEPSASNNEGRSAQLANYLLSPFMSSSVVDDITSMILLTKRHHTPPHDVDGCIICDCDLAVMGWGWEKFAEFGDAIRQEYSHVSDDDFRRERRELMKSFLHRERIFQTEHFRNKYEKQARDNLRHTIALLS